MAISAKEVPLHQDANGGGRQRAKSPSFYRPLFLSFAYWAMHSSVERSESQTIVADAVRRICIECRRRRSEQVGIIVKSEREREREKKAESFARISSFSCFGEDCHSCISLLMHQRVAPQLRRRLHRKEMMRSRRLRKKKESGEDEARSNAWPLFYGIASR